MIYKMPFPYWNSIAENIDYYPARQIYDLGAEESAPLTDVVEEYIEQEYGLRYTGKDNIPTGNYSEWDESYNYEIIDETKFNYEFMLFLLKYSK